MKFLRVKAIARKETIQILRDPLSLAMAFLVPLFLLVIFGYAITFDIRDIDAVVLDRDRSSQSRALVSALRESGYFSIAEYAADESDIDRALDAGLAKVALMIPPDFSARISSGRTASLGVIIDGSDANTATIARGYIAGITRRFSEELSPVRIRPIIEARSRVWYNAELKSRNFIIPGLIAVIMGVIVALLTSLTISREWERGTMEQLIATPVRTPELIIGKLAPYFLIGFIDTVASVAMGTQLFGVPLRGSVPEVLGVSAVFLAGGLCMGILISIIARQQLLSSQMALLITFLPAFLLSGFIFTITNLPRPIQIATYAVPARYFVTVLKSVFLKGVPLRMLAADIALLVLFGAVMFGLANRRFRKKVE